MGLLEKLGIIEPISPDPQMEDLTEQELAALAGRVEAEVPDSVTETLIDDIYAENEMSDMSKAIYKVDVFINTLPKEMPQATKKATVLSILGASGITVNEVMEDGESRKSILCTVRSEIDADNSSKIESAEAEIERLRAEIENQNTIIYNAKAEMEAADKRIDDEIAVINSLENFIGGEKAE